tara:strand:- start:560 stop:973 length:414 start_codon:yes stop_codon:yes gene_type:complete
MVSHPKKTEEYIKAELHQIHQDLSEEGEKDLPKKSAEQLAEEHSASLSKKKTSELCVAAFLLSLFGLIFPPFALLAIIFAISGLMQSSRAELRGKTLAILAIIFSLIGFVIALFLVIFAVEFVKGILNELGPVLSQL